MSNKKFKAIEERLGVLEYQVGVLITRQTAVEVALERANESFIGLHEIVEQSIDHNKGALSAIIGALAILLQEKEATESAAKEFGRQ